MIVLDSIALLALAAGNSNHAPATSALVVETCDFGETFQYQVVECPISIRNPSHQSIGILEVTAINDADKAQFNTLKIEPGETTSLRVSVGVEGASGMTSRMFNLKTDEKNHPSVNAYAFGYVSSVLKNPRVTVDFGSVDLTQKLPKREVALEGFEGAGFKILRILTAPEYFDTSVSPDGRRVVISINSKIPWGYHSDERIVVTLDSELQKKAELRVSLNAIGSVTTTENPYSLGVVRNDKSRDYFIPLQIISVKPIISTRAVLDGVPGSADVVECESPSKTCRRVRLNIGNALAMGPFLGRVSVDLPEFGQHLNIGVKGIALPPGFDPVEDPKGSDVSNVKKASESKSQSVDIGEAMKAPVKEVNMPPPVGRGPLLKWSVGNEGSVYGYIVLRGDTRTGSFLRVSKDVIKAEAFEPHVVNPYQWRDTSANPGSTYWYEIAVLHKNGDQEVLTSPQRVLAK